QPRRWNEHLRIAPRMPCAPRRSVWHGSGRARNPTPLSHTAVWTGFVTTLRIPGNHRKLRAKMTFEGMRRCITDGRYGARAASTRKVRRGCRDRGLLYIRPSAQTSDARRSRSARAYALGWNDEDIHRCEKCDVARHTAELASP